MNVLSALHDEVGLGGAHDIEVQGNLAFVGGKGRGGNRIPPHGPGSFAIVDIADPREPRILWRWALEPEDGHWIQAETVLPAGDVCYVGGTYFWTLDVSDPAHTRIAHSIRDPRISTVNGMVRRGNTVFAANKTNCITVFDVGDPLCPELLHAAVPRGTNFESPHDIALLDEERIVVVNIQPGEPRDKFHVYHVGCERDGAPLPPDRWTLESVLDDTRLLGANRVRVRGHWAYVACNRGDAVATVDLATPAAPRLAGYLPTPAGPSGMTLAGDLMIVAPGCGRTDLVTATGMAPFLEFYDVGDPENPELLLRESFSEVSPDHDLVCRDGLLYVTDQDEDKMAVIEITEPDLLEHLENRK